MIIVCHVNRSLRFWWSWIEVPERNIFHDFVYDIDITILLLILFVFTNQTFLLRHPMKFEQHGRPLRYRPLDLRPLLEDVI